MTDRHAGYIVVLSHDVREDDADQIIKAISLLRGVLTVRPIVSDIPLAIAAERVQHRVQDKLYDLARNLKLEEER